VEASRKRLRRRNTKILLVTGVVISLILICATLAPHPPQYPKAGYILYASGGGSAKTNSGYIFLAIPPNPAGNWDAWAKVRVYWDMNFDDIEGFSFDYNLLLGELTPYMILEVDTDGDTFPDLWVVQWPSKVEERGTWQTYAKDDWHIEPWSAEGDCLRCHTPPVRAHLSLEEVQEMIDGRLKGVKVAIGEWPNTDQHWALIDNVTTNGQVILEVL